jgi:hypothetical protein
MALPVTTQLKTMDFAFQGQPFVDTIAKGTIDTWGMDVAFQGSPFVTNQNQQSAWAGTMFDVFQAA